MSVSMGKGKRKIEIKRIENQKSRIVTFSKRRQGLFKKAHEYSQCTGAEVAILIFSPAGKPFIHGSPSFEKVIEKFVNGGNRSGLGNSEGVENDEIKTEVRGFLAALEEKMSRCRSGENLAAMKSELEEVREKVLRRLIRLEEDEFVSSLLNL